MTGREAVAYGERGHGSFVAQFLQFQAVGVLVAT
jgi:hypothetical protein